MKITFISPVANMSGGIRVLAIYAKELMLKGHQVRIISLPAKDLTFRARFKSLMLKGQWPKYVRHPKSHFDDLGLDHRILERYRTPTNDDIPDGDVVIATWWETAEWIYHLNEMKGVKVYFIQHHEIFPHLPIERVHNTYRMPFHQIVVSSWLKDLMYSIYGNKTVDLVPNSIDHLQFFAPLRSRQKHPTIGFLYHQVSFKGCDITISAIAKLRKFYPDLRVICFGSNKPSGQLHLEDWIEFYHDPEQSRIKDLYASCDVWVTASRSEGFNLTAMEAMACRTPIVSTRTGWPMEAIESYRNGILVDVDDVDGIVAAVQWVLSLSEEQWQNLSLAAYKTVETSNWEKSADLFEKALIRACERG